MYMGGDRHDPGVGTMIGYVVTSNSAIQIRSVGMYVWRGDNTKPGLYFDPDTREMIYVDKAGVVYVAVNMKIIDDDEGLYVHCLLTQPENDWQRCPETGERIMYQVLDPVEYVFT
jgi:hypothetical protein